MAGAKKTDTKATPRRTKAAGRSPAGKPAARTTMLHVRIRADVKAEAEAVLDELGITPSDAIRVFYKQVALRRGLPFDVLIPNEETQQILRDADAGKGLLGPFKDTDEMFRELGIDLGER